jgi:signal transduction histidine kinase
MSERLRLLVVDDDLVDRLAIRRAIEQSGLPATIVEASTAAEALAQLRTAGPIDCVLLDQDLPGMSGVDLTAQLRGSGVHVPIVFVTAQQNEELLQQAVDAGVTDFIPKHDLSPRRVGLRVSFAIRIGNAEAESSRAVARATEAARARDEILAVVSHDLRGPLHAISLATEALRDEVKGPAARYLGAIERASTRAERLITDLLEASAIENGGLTLTRTSIDAGAMLRQAAADYELLVKETGGKIAARVPEEQIVVSADRDRVLQVLGNLIGNSLKHAKGAPIELSVERKDREALIVVHDQGPGIAETELPHVFDRYWSGRTKRGGAGLGLAIAKGIVSAHGGQIQVDSNPGSGAKFVFTLPLAPHKSA